MKRQVVKYFAIVVILLTLTTTAKPVAAAGWDWDFALYLFALGLDGTTVVRGNEAEVDLSFGDILEDLEMAATGHLEARKRGSRWGFFGDVFYSSLGAAVEQPNVEWDMNQTYLEGAVTYAMGENFSFLGGLRYTTMELTLDVTPSITPPVEPGPGPQRFQGDQSWTDLMIGGRYRKSLGERWGFSARGDLAGFGISSSSDLTWNVVLLGQFKATSRIGLILGYRWFDVDYENADDLFVFDVMQQGPVFAFNYSFY
jgi:hypothetical protein